ncbi:MAG: MFS transporter [Akkermansia sp.]
MNKSNDRIFSEFKILGTISKDFWLTNGIQFFEGLSYFSLITIFTLYLTDNCGFSDIASGAWVSIFTLYVTAFVLAVGSICDVIGIKKSFYIGLGLLLISRLGLWLAPMYCQGDVASIVNGAIGTSFQFKFSVEQITVMSSILVMSLGTAFIGPVTQAALRRFTSARTRATGFNIYYIIMNVSAIAANLIMIDYFRSTYGPTEGNIHIMNFIFLMTLGAFICVYFIDENNYADKEEIIEEQETRRPLHIFLEVWKESAFQKLVAFLLLTIGVRLVFTLQFLVMPKYYTRVLYDDFNLGAANAINPVIIVFGLIAVLPFIHRFSTIKLMVWGMAISAFSLVLMVLPIEWFLAVPGVPTLSQAFFFVIVTQILMFALGELLFSPRFTEYVASVAPKDKVASYMALSALPMFIAKPINGFLSGILISLFCYDGIRAKIDTSNITYGDSPQFMWLIYFIMAALSPICIILFKKRLEIKKAQASLPEKEEEEASAAASVYLDSQETQADEIGSATPANH